MSTLVKRGKKPWASGWQVVTLRASAAFVVGDTPEVSNIFDLGDWDNLIVALDLTVAITDAEDTLNVKIDGSWDGVNFFNMGEFHEWDATEEPQTELMFFEKGRADDPNAVVTITGDAGEAVVRPGMCCPFVRVTSAMVDADTDGSFTFSVIAYAQ